MYQLLIAVLILFLVTGCSEQQQKVAASAKEKKQGQTATAITQKNGALDAVKEKKQITFIMLNAPTVYYQGADGNTGYEYDMAVDFANYLGVALKIYTVYTLEEAMNALNEGKGDIAAAGFSITPEREKTYLFGPSFYTVQPTVVCNSGIKAPRDTAALANYTIDVPSNTTYVKTLQTLQKLHSSIQFKIVNESTETILKQINENAVECTIADSNVYAYNRRYFTQTRAAFTTGKDERLAWLLRNGEKKLKGALDTWYAAFVKNGGAKKLDYRYYAFTEFDNNDQFKVFSERIEKRLIRYSEMFKEAGAKYGIPWQFLAAVSYKESSWQPSIKGFNGAEGMMMLTQKTAQELGVKDRLNPKENIDAGAQNLAYLEKQIPKEVTNPIQRLYYTLLAYKVGSAHLQDAIAFAQAHDKNPYNWNDFKTIVQLLSKKEYFSQTAHGYANFLGAMIYVNQVIDFYDVLNHTKL